MRREKGTTVIDGRHFRLLGCRVRDKITGFSGVATSVCFDLYGCIQTVISPGLNEKGEPGDGRWFDNNRIELVDEEAEPLMRVPNFAYELDRRDETGPADKPAIRASELPTKFRRKLGA